MFSDRAQPIFNEHAWPTEFADPVCQFIYLNVRTNSYLYLLQVMPIPSIPLDDDLAPLAIVPMPFSADGTYLSDWPAELCKRVYRYVSFLSGLFRFHILAPRSRWRKSVIAVDTVHDRSPCGGRNCVLYAR